MKIRRILLNNIGLKALALFLAFITWLYVGEAAKIHSEKTILQRIFASSYYVSKKLYVKPVFVGDMPEGYKFIKTEVKVNPEYIMVLGSAKIMPKKDFIYTKPIDLSEHTISKTIDADLQSVSPQVKLQKTVVEVYIPVQKLEKDKAKSTRKK